MSHFLNPTSPNSPNTEIDFVESCRSIDKLKVLGVESLKDIEIIRILQANHDDSLKAVNDIVDLLNWRKDMNYEKVLSAEYPEYCQSILYLYDFTPCGSPIIVYKAKNHTPLTDDVDMIMKSSIALMGNIQRKHNNPQVILLFDKEGATKDNVNIALAKQTISLFTKFFPETLKELLVFPSNFLLYSLWSVLKPFMDPVTVVKVKLIYIGFDSW